MMCNQGETQKVWLGNGESVDVDRCIAGLVVALNGAGLKTIAACCGHGDIGIISLADGRRIFITQDTLMAEELLQYLGTRLSGEDK